MSRRVMVTGMGCVSAAGLGVDALWDAARAGRSCVGPVPFVREHGIRVRMAAQVVGFDPGAHLSDIVVSRTERFSQLAMVAAQEAVAQAGIAAAERLGARTAVIVGTGIGGASTLDEGHRRFYLQDGRIDPLTIPRVMANAAAAHIAMLHGATGPSFAVSSACASAAQSVGIGLAMIRAGAVDRAIVGGSEAMITPSVFRAWEMLRVMTPGLCRPFSQGRNGMVLGEGAAILVIEAEDRMRGPALAELAGYGTTSDAADLLRADPGGGAAAIGAALQDAGLAPAEIDYVNAHGTGTIANDSTEVQALRQVFGARLGGIAVSSTKPIHGHAMGAAGALELVITIAALRHGFAPPTINWIGADPACDIDAVANTGRALPIRASLSNSFAFGGVNAVLAIRPV